MYMIDLGKRQMKLYSEFVNDSQSRIESIQIDLIANRRESKEFLLDTIQRLTAPQRGECRGVDAEWAFHMSKYYRNDNNWKRKFLNN